ncbi:hypothetical protein N0V90_012300 [Kalmusia sp. IMI 367209]|nr:hypothetical protein N0V90_012300 [Kalmusia sp. IMI 367209]
MAWGRVPVVGNVKLKILSERRSRKTDEKFSGLFLFEFDEEGRVVKHTIEHVEENGQWDKTAKVISVTDWLLGGWGRREEGAPSLAYVKSSKAKQVRHVQDCP